ncbi:MAG TPA: hypothetical protein VIH42_07050 [Thermoguttaceae bacterium]
MLPAVNGEHRIASLRFESVEILNWMLLQVLQNPLNDDLKDEHDEGQW